MNRTPVFIDCDNTMGVPSAEIDDGLTILYLLDHPGVDVVGISTTHGNADVDTTTRQTGALMAALGANIPVHRGGSSHSKASDGSIGSWRSTSEAARALVAASREHEGRLVVLGLGALSNLAGAAELDPLFFERLGSVLLMGGYRGPLRFPRREVAELNFSADPPASLAVLTAPAPVTVMSAQLCLAARFSGWNLVVSNAGPRWLARLVREWYAAFTGSTGAKGFYLWDLVPAVAVTEPERMPAARYRLVSTVDDLRTGRLVLDSAPSESARTPSASGPSPSAPGIVSVPDLIVRPRRLVAECARRWNRAARRVRPGTEGMLRPPDTV